ncbi:MAG: PhnD/SsuA/transferrin family substrate-binding protein [Smithella sp.]
MRALNQIFATQATPAGGSPLMPRDRFRLPRLGIIASGLQLSKWLIVCLCGVISLSGSGAAETPSPPFRIGFSSSMFSDVNENDARAAVKVWGQMIAKARNVPTNPTPLIFKNEDEVLQSLQEKKVDAVAIVMPEFAKLQRKVRFAPIFLTSNSGVATEQYILLVRQDSSIKRPAHLRGRSLLFQKSPRNALSTLWMDTLLAKQGYPVASRFVGKISQNNKLSNVILPVFFRRADACVVTRSGFNTMNALNPQLGRQLTVIAESSEMVPAVLTFRADYDPPFKEQLFAGINELKETPAGQQVLTIFHSDHIAQYPWASLNAALKLIETHEKLSRRGK